MTDPKTWISLAALTARCALVGATLHQVLAAAGHREFIVSRWHLTKSFATLDEVDAWLARLEGGTR